MLKAEKVLLAVVLLMLGTATVARASFFYGPYKQLFPTAQTAPEAPAYTGTLVVTIKDGLATGIMPEGCEKTQVCVKTEEILENLGSAKFIVRDGDRLTLAENAAQPAS